MRVKFSIYCCFTQHHSKKQKSQE